MNIKSPSQLKFDLMLKSLAAELVEVGFKRNGLVFRKFRPECFSVIEFQKSSQNSSGNLKFTFNLGVVAESLASKTFGPAYEKRTTASAHLMERIGFLTPARSDRWWEISQSTSLTDLSSEILDLIEKLAIPFLDKYSNVGALLATWENGNCPGLTEGQQKRFIELLSDKKSPIK